MRAFIVVLAALFALPSEAWAAPPNVIIKAQYEDPTTRYDHGILGDKIEWGALRLTVDQCFGCKAKSLRDFVIRLPESRVFEDTAPRLVDLDGDASPEVMVVETDIARGARLAIYDENGLITATPFIGQTHRWLAPIGAADLDGDGLVEIAYVDRPHLARLIRVWRFEDASLKLVAELAGFTNHAIGEDTIAGGIRDCGQGPEMIVADARWRDLYAVTMANDVLTATKIGPHNGRQSFRRAMNCNL
ncbi:MAG: FG-GAP repeat domain-containing protein [Paracoccaceae bacterium]